MYGNFDIIWASHAFLAAQKRRCTTMTSQLSHRIPPTATKLVRFFFNPPRLVFRPAGLIGLALAMMLAFAPYGVDAAGSTRRRGVVAERQVSYNCVVVGLALALGHGVWGAALPPRPTSVQQAWMDREIGGLVTWSINVDSSGVSPTTPCSPIVFVHWLLSTQQHGPHGSICVCRLSPPPPARRCRHPPLPTAAWP